MGINTLHSNLGNGQGQAKARHWLAKARAFSLCTLPVVFNLFHALVIAGPRFETILRERAKFLER